MRDPSNRLNSLPPISIFQNLSFIPPPINLKTSRTSAMARQSKPLSFSSFIVVGVAALLLCVLLNTEGIFCKGGGGGGGGRGGKPLPRGVVVPATLPRGGGGGNRKSGANGFLHSSVSSGFFLRICLLGIVFLLGS